MEVACTRRLVDAVDNLFETVCDDLVNGALSLGEVHHLVGIFIIVSAIFFLDEMAHIHQKLGCGASS